MDLLHVAAMLSNGLEEMQRVIDFHPGSISRTLTRGIRSRLVRWSWAGKGAADHVCLAGATPNRVARRPADRIALALAHPLLEGDSAPFSPKKRGRCHLSTSRHHKHSQKGMASHRTDGTAPSTDPGAPINRSDTPLWSGPCTPKVLERIP